MQDNTPLPRHIMRVADLPQRKPTRISLRPEAPELAAIAADLGLLGLRKLSFEAELAPAGKRDWRLTGKIGATVIQPCVVTLEPVTTRIDEPVERLFMAEMPEIQDEKIEMAEDDNIDPLTPELDIAGIMIESLSLNLPLYPRAEGAEAVNMQVTEPGKAAMTDEDAKPFAGLAALKAKLNGGEGTH